MNIGIDIDGCLNNFQDALNHIIERDFGATNLPQDKYEMLPFANININNQEQCRAFWDKYNHELLELVDVEPRAAQTIKMIKQLGFGIDIITARGYNCAGITEKWLQRSDIYYDNLFFETGNKLDACNYRGIKVIVEDKPSTVQFLANNGIKVLKYNRPYNLTVEHPNVIPVNNWSDIYNEAWQVMKNNFAESVNKK
jgi:uncharacterized HAD superfamily protein